MNLILVFILFFGFFFVVYCKDYLFSLIIRKVRVEESLSDEEKIFLV